MIVEGRENNYFFSYAESRENLNVNFFFFSTKKALNSVIVFGAKNY